MSHHLSSQTRTGSFAEAMINVVAGFALAIIVQRVAYPLFGIATTLGQDGLIALIFTATSLVRSYSIRRLFVMLECQRQRHREGLATSLQRRLASGRL